MKRFLIIIAMLLLVGARAFCQPRFSSSTETFQLGKIEWKHPARVQYSITNTGTEPLVLSDVEPDCDCTVAEWTQTPIAPGEKGMVTVTYDAETLGYFRKSVAVWMNAEPHLTYLHFAGQVVTEVKDFGRTHPYEIGELRLDTTTIDFPEVYLGDRPVFHMSIANTSLEPYEPVLMHLPQFLTMEASSNMLQPGEKCDVEITLNTELLPDYGLTQVPVYLSRFMGDKVSEENEIPVSVVLLPDFSHLTDAQRAQAPVISLSATQLDMSAALATKTKAHQDIMVTNQGKSALQIGKLQVFNSSVSTSMKKGTLQPGESVRLRVTVNKKQMNRSRTRMRLLIICNDPEHPMTTVEIKVAQ